MVLSPNKTSDHDKAAGGAGWGANHDTAWHVVILAAAVTGAILAGVAMSRAGSANTNALAAIEAANAATAAANAANSTAAAAEAAASAAASSAAAAEILAECTYDLTKTGTLTSPIVLPPGTCPGDTTTP